MHYLKSLMTTLALILIFAIAVVGVNLYIDHYAVRMILFSPDKPLYPASYPDGMNQHMFNPEYVFRNRNHFDSFLFGSSRTSVIDVAKIPNGRFFNMSYTQGLPAEHLAIIKAFLDKGIEIKSIVVGLDDFCFNITASEHKNHLMRIMHPDINGPNRAVIFGTYFFRKPDMIELKGWKDKLIHDRPERRFTMDSRGLVLRWNHADQIIETKGKPIFHYVAGKYKPLTYQQKATEESFAAIEELIALSKEHNFSLTFFISPFYAQTYLNNAEALFKIKERLARLTDYYDFSGFNSVTTNAMNYYEESHYRYLVGDMMIKRMFGTGDRALPDDFGVWVTKQNVNGHLEKQKRELIQYRREHNLN